MQILGACSYLTTLSKDNIRNYNLHPFVRLVTHCGCPVANDQFDIEDIIRVLFSRYIDQGIRQRPYTDTCRIVGLINKNMLNTVTNGLFVDAIN